MSTQIMSIGSVDLGSSGDYSALLKQPARPYLVSKSNSLEQSSKNHEASSLDYRSIPAEEFMQAIPGKRFYDYNKYLRGELSLRRKVTTALVAGGLAILLGWGLAQVKRLHVIPDFNTITSDSHRDFYFR